MDISKRLLTVAGAVTPGNRVADVGTDHGYVPIFLVKNAIVPSAIAMDINKGPLEKADLHIREEGLGGKIATRLSDGMEKLQSGEADTVVIAGMGGELTSRILRSRADLLAEGVELVLSPHSEWYKVRHTLHELDYEIEREWFLKDDGKYYMILRAHPGHQSFASEAEYMYGAVLEEVCRPVLEEYLEKTLKKRANVVEAIRGQSPQEPDQQAEKAEKQEPDQQTEQAEKKAQKNLCRREQRIHEIEAEMGFMREKLERLRAGR